MRPRGIRSIRDVEIFRRLKRGEAPEAISKAMGVHIGTVQRIQIAVGEKLRASTSGPTRAAP